MGSDYELWFGVDFMFRSDENQAPITMFQTPHNFVIADAEINWKSKFVIAQLGTKLDGNTSGFVCNGFQTSGGNQPISETLNRGLDRRS